MLKIFVWDKFAPDYSDGLVFAIAKDRIEARKLVIEKMGYSPDVWGNLKVFELDKPVAFCVSGKG